MVEQLSDTNYSARTGIVYILSNAAMPNYIKIGTTGGNSPSDVQKRMRELDATGVPRPFNCEYAAVVENPTDVEKALHTAFGDYRVRQSREFFEGLAPSMVKAVLKLFQRQEVTPGVPIGGNDEPPEKPPSAEKFRFNMVNIKPGARLQWADNPEIECVVVDGIHIEYEGERTSLSKLAGKLKGWKSTPAGPMHWMYEGETLVKRRERFDRETDEDDE